MLADEIVVMVITMITNYIDIWINRDEMYATMILFIINIY